MSIYLGTNLISGTQDISGKANTSLDNLTSTGKNIGNWSSNVTNCITNIPQDIKLELNNGTLTLKAGSKLYVPNGTGVFDEVIVDSDKTASISSFSGFVFYRSDNNGFHLEALQPTSGTTPPSGDGTWYDTSANKIKRYENSSFVYDGISFPLCKCSSGSIDQIFNGFGYIGSTVFALPGVKGLFCNGRNDDGTLSSVPFELQNVSTFNEFNNGFPNCIIIKRNLEIARSNFTQTSYDEKTNYIVRSVGDGLFKEDMIAGNLECSVNGITSFHPKTVFHALDYNDKGTIAGWGMPSSRYISLTTAASGTNYQAPANGYFRVSGTASAAGQRLNLDCGQVGFQAFSHASGNEIKLSCPAKKGRNMYLAYNMPQANVVIRFIYAEGEQ